jgi:glycosyltransferase involved in cell wall biosynthesis
MPRSGPIRLCWIIPWFGPKHSYIENDLPQYLIQEGIQLKVLTSEYQPEFYVRDWESKYQKTFGSNHFPVGVYSHNNIEIHRLPTKVIHRWPLLSNLSKEVADFCPDIIESSGISAPLSLQSSRIAKKLSVPHVISHHMPLQRGQQNFIFGAIQSFIGRRTLHNASGLFFVSDEAKSHAAEHYGRFSCPNWLMPLGVNTNQFHSGDRIYWENNRKSERKKLGLEIDTPLVIYSGRLEEEKGMNLLSKTIHALKDTNIHFAFAGQGTCEHLLRECPKTHMLGYISNNSLRDLYCACDLAVWPDSMSVSQLQVLACGSELLIPSENPKQELLECGAQTFKRDNHNSLTKSIIRICKNAEATWANAQQKSRKVALTYSWNAIAKKRAACYSQVLV